MSDIPQLLEALETRLHAAGTDTREDVRSHIEALLAHPDTEIPPPHRNEPMRAEDERERLRAKMFGAERRAGREELEAEYVRRKGASEARKDALGGGARSEGFSEQNVLSGLGQAYRSPMYEPELRARYKRQLEDQIAEKRRAARRDQRARQREELGESRAIEAELRAAKRAELRAAAEKKQQFRRTLDAQLRARR